MRGKHTWQTHVANTRGSTQVEESYISIFVISLYCISIIYILICINSDSGELHQHIFVLYIGYLFFILHINSDRGELHQHSYHIFVLYIDYLYFILHINSDRGELHQHFFISLYRISIIYISFCIYNADRRELHQRRRVLPCCAPGRLRCVARRSGCAASKYCLVLM